MIVTMMTDSKAPNNRLLYFAGIFFNFNYTNYFMPCDKPAHLASQTRST
jgi:hypothetical protein